jgi:hypothetical protein
MTLNLNPWTYKYIRQRVEEATLEAEQLGLRPTLGQEAARNFRTSNRFNIPFLGDYIPPGWERLDEEVFVDTTGGGQSNNVVTTQFDFFRRITQRKDDVAYGVIELGQLQALVATYRRKDTQ